MPREIKVRIVKGIVVMFAGMVIAIVGSFLVNLVMVSISFALMQPEDMINNRPDAIAPFKFACQATAITFLTGVGITGIAFVSTLITWARWFVGPAETDSQEDGQV